MWWHNWIHVFLFFQMPRYSPDFFKYLPGLWRLKDKPEATLSIQYEFLAWFYCKMYFSVSVHDMTEFQNGNRISYQKTSRWNLNGPDDSHLSRPQEREIKYFRSRQNKPIYAHSHWGKFEVVTNTTVNIKIDRHLSLKLKK